MPTPIVYSAEMEELEAEEEKTAEKLAGIVRDILEKTSKDYGHAVRSVHAKSHAILQGTLTVLPNLPAPYAQGLFAQPGSYPAVMRISTVPGDILPDSVSAPRGLALKVLNVPGERLPGHENDTTQDFVMVDGPVFGVAHAKSFAPQLDMLAKTTDRVEGLKKVMSFVLRGLEGALEAVGGQSTLVQQMGGRPLTHPLGDKYFSQTPFLFGQNIAKFSLAPVSESLTAHEKEKIDLGGRADALREEVERVTATAAMTWELRVQLCVDLEKMPVEDPSKKWDEELSPFVTVARLEVPAQSGWNEARSKAVDDGMAFDVWHTLAAHRPLGSINRVRRVCYPFSAAFRGTFNGCPMHEPKDVKL